MDDSGQTPSLTNPVAQRPAVAPSVSVVQLEPQPEQLAQPSVEAAAPKDSNPPQVQDSLGESGPAI